MKRQTQSTQSLPRNSANPAQQDTTKASLFPSLESYPKLEKIPTTFVFDKRIPPSEYKNYISIDDIFNENFEYARKLFEDPSRAFVVADQGGDHKIPRRLAQVNQKRMAEKDNLKTPNKSDKQVQFGHKTNNYTGSGSINNNNNSNVSPAVGGVNSMQPSGSIQLNQQSQQRQQQLLQSQSQQLALEPLSKKASTMLAMQASPGKKEDMFENRISDLTYDNIKKKPAGTMETPGFFQQESTYIHQLGQNQQQMETNTPQNILHAQSTQHPGGQLTSQQQQQSSLQQSQQHTLQNEKSAKQQQQQISVQLGKRMVKTADLKEKKIKSDADDRVQGLITQTREKVKRLQTYADKLKKRVMQNDFGHNYKRSQRTIKKSQLVKNFIFNETDFNKMLIQEEEEDKKNMANKKEKNIKGFIERQDLSSIGHESHKFPYAYQSQTFEQYASKKNETKERRTSSNNMNYDDEDDESEMHFSKQDNKLDTSGDKTKDAKFKSSKHNFHKKMHLKKRQIENETIFQEAEGAYEKAVGKLGGFERHWNHIGILSAKTNKMRVESLECARQGKILKTMNEKYGELDLIQTGESSSKLKINNDDELLNHLQALLTKPDATGDFRLHKQVQVHKNRIKNMRQKDVGIVNISNLTIDA